MEMKKAYRRLSTEEVIYQTNIVNQLPRGTLIEVHISDIHFGAFDPKTQYDILEEQFISKLYQFRFDILSIDGDLFDHKFMSNSDTVMYATIFINKLVERCREIGATLIMIAGTEYHDAKQLKLFYHYTQDPTVDVRIVEQVQFEYVKGAKILCIPELYNMGDEYYANYLYNQGYYDSVFMHGTYEGAVYQAKNQESGINSEFAPTFNMNNFVLCEGPMISGHVHTGGCFGGYFYYNGSPLRYHYGEENEKGFLIVFHNLDTQAHYVHLEPIYSFRYDTIEANDLISRDPQEIINYLDNLHNQGIHHIRLKITKVLSDSENANYTILKNYYRNSDYINILYNQKRSDQDRKIMQDLTEEYKNYSYLLDSSLDAYTKFVMYVNSQEDGDFINVEELKNILEE